jgi:hypothetical protein
MPYNFDLVVSARIPKAVAEDMIRQVVEEQTGKKVSSIEILLKESAFDGFQISFKEEKTKSAPIKGAFVKAEYQ